MARQVEHALSMSRGADFVQHCQAFQLPAQAGPPGPRPCGLSRSGASVPRPAGAFLAVGVRPLSSQTAAARAPPAGPVQTGDRTGSAPAIVTEAPRSVRLRRRISAQAPTTEASWRTAIRRLRRTLFGARKRGHRRAPRRRLLSSIYRNTMIMCGHRRSRRVWSP